MELKKGKFNLETVMVISIAHLIHDVFTSFLAPLMPMLIDKFNLSYFSGSALNVARKTPSLLSLILGSVINKLDDDKIHYLIVLTPLTTSFLMSLLGILPSYFVLLLVLLLVGFSSTIFHIIAPSMIKEISGKQVGKGVSFYQLGGEAARSIGPLVILGFLAKFELEKSYFLIIAGGLVSLLLYLKIKDINLHHIFENSSDNDVSLKKVIKTNYKFILNIGGIKFFWNLTKIALTLFLPTYLKTVKGVSIWVSGGALSVLQLAGAGGTYCGGIISDKYGRKTIIFLLMICTIFAMGFFSISQGIILLPLIIILGFCIYAMNPIILALVQEKGSDYLIELNSFYKTVSFVSSTMATLLIGKMGDIMGLGLVYKLIPGCLVLSLALILNLNLE